MLTPPPQPEPESDAANPDRRPARKADDAAESASHDETRVPGVGEPITVIPPSESSDDATRIPLPSAPGLDVTRVATPSELAALKPPSQFAGGESAVSLDTEATSFEPFTVPPPPSAVNRPQSVVRQSTAGVRRPGTGRSSGADGPLKVGEAFGNRYQITKVLGVGGMGAVYQAWDAELGITVALKVIRPEIAADPFAALEIERRFKRELLLARQVTHRNVVRIHDLGEIDGIKYITMSYIEGSDLATILKKETRLPAPRALRIARGIASGLVTAHEAGVVHRDLKPANIMIAADDEPTIMDFGIARSSSRSGQEAVPGVNLATADLSKSAALLSGKTVAGAVIGTVEYMAPE